MNPRLKSVFKGVATGLAMVVVLNSGSALYDHFTQGDEPAAVPTQDFGADTSQKPTFTAEQVKGMKFTAEEMAGAERFTALQSCIEAGKVGVQLAQSMSAGGEFEMAETAEQAFDRAAAKCEADTGMTVDAANAFVDGLNQKYGDALETVYQNSLPPKPAAP